MPRRRPALACFAIWLALTSNGVGAAHAQLIAGIEEWAEATTEAAEAKWRGPRFPYPTPRPRPGAAHALVSLLYPVAVHGSARDSPAALAGVLAAVEEAYVELAALGLFTRFGDGGLGGGGAFDIYLEDGLAEGSAAFADASWPERELDAASAFASVDRRLPTATLAACSSEALAKLALLELDPAETDSVRASVAALLSEWVRGARPCSSSAEAALETPELAPFPRSEVARGAPFLGALLERGSARPEQLLQQSVMLARQLTWEGHDLRASPSLLEALARILGFERVKLEELAGELAVERLTQERLPGGLETSFAELPLHGLLGPLEPFGHAFIGIDTRSAEAGRRLRVWLHGELGVRWSLIGSRYDTHGRLLGHVRTPIREHPERFLPIELDARTARVVITVSNVGNGVPSQSEPPGLRARAATITVDR